MKLNKLNELNFNPKIHKHKLLNFIYVLLGFTPLPLLNFVLALIIIEKFDEDRNNMGFIFPITIHTSVTTCIILVWLLSGHN